MRGKRIMTAYSRNDTKSDSKSLKPYMKTKLDHRINYRN